MIAIQVKVPYNTQNFVPYASEPKGGSAHLCVAARSNCTAEPSPADGCYRLTTPKGVLSS